MFEPFNIFKQVFQQQFAKGENFNKRKTKKRRKKVCICGIACTISRAFFLRFSLFETV